MTKTLANQNCSSSHPIPIPSHPKQYRAIGIVRGIYQPSPSAITKGELMTLTGEKIETVLLGKTIGAVKNHVDLSQKNYWIVYPHSTFQADNPLHLQITGIWQPNSNQDNNQFSLTEDYFSIRGEVIYSSRQEEKVIVKIYFNNSTQKTRGNFFKLQLKGKIPNYTIKHFYNFDVILAGQQLVIKEYIDLGFIAVRYSGFSLGKKRTKFPQKRFR